MCVRVFVWRKRRKKCRWKNRRQTTALGLGAHKCLYVYICCVGLFFCYFIFHFCPQHFLFSPSAARVSPIWRRIFYKFSHANRMRTCIVCAYTFIIYLREKNLNGTKVVLQDNAHDWKESCRSRVRGNTMAPRNSSYFSLFVPCKLRT